MINTCRSNCRSQSASFAILTFVLRKLQLNPVVSLPMTLRKVGRTFVTVSLTVSKPGSLYCRAFDQNFTVTAICQVKDLRSAVKMSVSAAQVVQAVDVHIEDLPPGTKYNEIPTHHTIHSTRIVRKVTYFVLSSESIHITHTRLTDCKLRNNVYIK